MAAEALLKYVIKAATRGLSDTDDAVRFGKSLTNMSDDFARAIESSDPDQVEKVIRLAAKSAKVDESSIFRNEALVSSLTERYKNSKAFIEDVEKAVKSGEELDLPELAKYHSIDQDSLLYRGIKDTLEEANAPKAEFGAAAGASASKPTAVGDSFSSDAARFSGMSNPLAWPYSLLRATARKFPEGSMGQVVLVKSANVYKYSALAGVGLTGLHFVSKGLSTEYVTKGLSKSVDLLQEEAPELAAYIQDNAPKLGELAYMALTIKTDMLTRAFKTLNHERGWDYDDDKMNMYAQLVQGNFIGFALETNGIKIEPEDIRKAIETAQNNKGDERAAFIKIISEISGKSEEEIGKKLPETPEIIDARNWSEEDIVRFAQDGSLPDGLSSPQNSASGDTTKPADNNPFAVKPINTDAGDKPATAPASTQQQAAGNSNKSQAGTTPEPKSAFSAAALALKARQAREKVEEASRATTQSARELMRIKALSGESLTQEFNKVVEDKGLSIFSSPKLILVSILDFIDDLVGDTIAGALGLDKMSSMMKKEIIAENTISQFGDKFNLMADKGPKVSLDTSPNPAG